MIRKKFFLMAALLISCTQTLSCHGKDEMAYYLFAYFTSDKANGENVYYALSEDGINFRPVWGECPVIKSDTVAVSKGIRDPHLVRGEDGLFYLVATDMQMSRGKFSNRGIVMMRSSDLIHWEHHTVHFPERYKGKIYAMADAVWAPQTIYDPSAGKYMVYFSLHSEKDGPFPQDAVYYAYANSGFSDLENDPQPLFCFPRPTIDADIVLDRQGVYHLFFNTWGGPEGLQRRQYAFTDLHRTETWTLLDGDMQPTIQGKSRIKSEGSTAYPLIGGGWILSYDCYADGVYHFCKTNDLQHFELVKETPATGIFTPRHGSVIQITECEYTRIIQYSKK